MSRFDGLIILVSDLDREIEALQVEHDRLLFEKIPELERKLRRANSKLEMIERTHSRMLDQRARARESLERQRKADPRP